MEVVSHDLILNKGIPAVFINGKPLRIITISYNYVGGTETKAGLAKAVVSGCFDDSDEVFIFEFDYINHTTEEL